MVVAQMSFSPKTAAETQASSSGAGMCPLSAAREAMGLQSPKVGLPRRDNANGTEFNRQTAELGGASEPWAGPSALWEHITTLAIIATLGMEKATLVFAQV